MASINITEVYNDNNGLVDTIGALNTISNGLFMDFILIAIFLMMLFMMKNQEFRNTFISSSVTTMFISILLWSGELVEFSRVIICFSIFVIALLYSWSN